jgi:nitronate monooxygenase
VTPEATVRSTFRERLVIAGTDDTVLTESYDLAIKANWPAGVAIRVLRNRFTDEWHGREAEIREWSQTRAEEFRANEYFARDGVMPAGESIGVINDVESAADLVRRLVAEADAILRDRAASIVG